MFKDGAKQKSLDTRMQYYIRAVFSKFSSSTYSFLKLVNFSPHIGNENDVTISTYIIWNRMCGQLLVIIVKVCVRNV